MGECGCGGDGMGGGLGVFLNEIGEGIRGIILGLPRNQKTWQCGEIPCHGGESPAFFEKSFSSISRRVVKKDRTARQQIKRMANTSQWPNFDEVRERFKGTKYKVVSDDTNSRPIIAAPSGKIDREARIPRPEVLSRFLEQPIEEIVCVGEYAAIASYSGGWIEAVVDSVYAEPVYARYSILFDSSPFSSDAKEPITVWKGSVRIILAAGSEPLWAYMPFFGELNRMMVKPGQDRPIVSLRIEGLKLATNADAVHALERISSSLFFQIDLLRNAPLTLHRVTERMRSGRIFRRGESALRDEVEFPAFEYDANALSYYWFARSAGRSPQFQFLSFYQVLEYFFVPFAQVEARSRVKQVLGDPRFRADRDVDLAKLIGACNVQQAYSEREQLRLTVAALTTNDEIQEFLDEDSDRRDFLTGAKGKRVSDLIIPAKDRNADLIVALANRIYDIRCQIVHTGAEHGEDSGKLLLPTAERIRHLGDDIAVVEWLARKALISSATPLSVKET